MTTYSKYGVEWFCASCGAGWDMDGPTDRCSVTDGCEGVAEGFAFYLGPADA